MRVMSFIRPLRALDEHYGLLAIGSSMIPPKFFRGGQRLASAHAALGLEPSVLKGPFKALEGLIRLM